MLAFLLFSAVSQCSAQITCSRVDTPIPVRAEGLAEQVSDVVLSCTGGTPTRSGVPLPMFQIILTSNALLPSHTLGAIAGQKYGWNDALLLIDDPSANQQIPCPPPGGSTYCPEAAGDAAPPNVFQGKQLQENAIVFQDIPIDPPGPGKTRLVRITNLRANIAGLPSQPNPQSVTISTLMFNSSGGAIPVNEPVKVVAAPQPAYSFSVRTSTNEPVASDSPGLTVAPSALSLNDPLPVHTFQVRFSEKFASAFRRRNIGTSGGDPAFLTSQSIPGTLFQTETGFLNTAFPSTTQMNVAGLADSGTRLKVVFKNVPAGIIVWVSSRDNPATTGFSANGPKAMLTYADAQGAGGFSYTYPYANGLSRLYESNGVYSATWEVVSADPNNLEDFNFTVALTAQNGSPGVGTATLNGTIAPTRALPGDSTVPVPSFVDLSTPVIGFTLSNSINTPAFAVVSGASYAAGGLAAGSILTGFGSGLANKIETSGDDGPKSALAGTTVDIVDSTGVSFKSLLFAVAPGQVNFVLDPNVRPGLAVVRISNNGKVAASGLIQVEKVSPGLFTASGDGQGAPAGTATIVSGTSYRVELLAGYDNPSGRWMPAPVDLRQSGDVYLTLFGTGFRNRTSQSAVQVTIGGVPVPVTFAAAQGTFQGLDQINVGPLPRSLAGRGEVDLLVSVEGKAANAVRVNLP